MVPEINGDKPIMNRDSKTEPHAINDLNQNLFTDIHHPLEVLETVFAHHTIDFRDSNHIPMGPTNLA
jgi:hypothetical protein